MSWCTDDDDDDNNVYDDNFLGVGFKDFAAQIVTLVVWWSLAGRWVANLRTGICSKLGSAL